MDAAARSKAEDETNARAAEVERLRVAAANAEEDRKRSEAEAAKLRAEADARRKADEDARTKATADAEAKRKADEAERQRLAALKVEEDRQRAAAEAKSRAVADEWRRADEEKRTSMSRKADERKQAERLTDPTGRYSYSERGFSGSMQIANISQCQIKYELGCMSAARPMQLKLSTVNITNAHDCDASLIETTVARIAGSSSIETVFEGHDSNRTKQSVSVMFTASGAVIATPKVGSRFCGLNGAFWGRWTKLKTQ